MDNFKDFKDKEKNNSKNYIKEFFFNKRIKYINKKFKTILEKYNIYCFTTPIYIKEPNKAIERLKLIIINKV